MARKIIRREGIFKVWRAKAESDEERASERMSEITWKGWCGILYFPCDCWFYYFERIAAVSSFFV